MRILFITCAHKSHLYQVVPLAWALRAAGHQVLAATAPDPGLTVGDVTATGLTALSAGKAQDIGRMAQVEAPKVAVVAPTGPRPHPDRKPVQDDYVECDTRVELEQMARIYPQVFSSASMVEDLIGFAREWRPDLVIWDQLQMFAGPAVARSCGAASARFLYAPDAVEQLRSAFRQQEGEADPIERGLRAQFEEYGWKYDDSTPVGDWTVDAMPPWTWKPAGARYLAMRPLSFNGPSAVPGWLYASPKPRRICITLGLTSQGVHSAIPPVEELFEAVADLDAEVVATLSRAQIAELSSIPGNVRVVDFVPMTTLLPTCAAVVHHGGGGTVFAALEHAVPQIILPSTFANEKYWGQVAHAQALESQGAGIYMDTTSPVTAEELHRHLVRVLTEPSFSGQAQRLGSQLRDLPAPGDLVASLVTLTAEHRVTA